MAITFTEDDVVAAYRRHWGYRPAIRGFIGRRKDGWQGCCPMSVMCLDNMPLEKYDVESVTCALGITEEEAMSFMDAIDVFDSRFGGDLETPETRAAWRLGRRVLRRLATEGMLSAKLTKKVLSLPEPE